MIEQHELSGRAECIASLDSFSGKALPEIHQGSGKKALRPGHYERDAFLNQPLPCNGVDGIQNKDHRSLYMGTEEIRLFLIHPRGSGFPSLIFQSQCPGSPEEISLIEGKTLPQEKRQIRHLNKPKPWLCAEQRLKIFL
jgi:hypothetical protein